MIPMVSEIIKFDILVGLSNQISIEILQDLAPTEW